MPSEFQNKLNRAFRELEKGRPELTQGLIEDIRADPIQDPKDAAAAGKLALQVGDIDMAIGLLSIALNDDPKNPTLLTQLGTAYSQSGEQHDALDALQKAHEVSPERTDTQLMLGRVYQLLDQFAQSQELLEKVLEADSNSVEAHCNLALALARSEKHEQAVSHVRKAVSLDNNNAETLNMAGSLLVNVGNTEEAKILFEKARKLSPSYATPFYNLAKLKRFTADDKKFIEQGEKLLEGSLKPEHRVALYFAMGKIHDDCGDTTTAFKYYQRGNVLRRPPTFEDPHELFERVRKLSLPSCRDVVGDIPVFIVGMPRSGSTLLEQILSSHPDIGGAGEVRHLTAMAYELLEFDKITPQSCENALEDYLGYLTTGRENASRVTDKMPSNYQYLGLIHALMPAAQIIHIYRDPIDTCLSCYLQNFAYQSWSFDLVQIGKVYSRYRQVMNHWHRTLPPGRILDVSYEALVDDIEGETRRICDHIGQPFDDACLDFVNNAKGVGTASNLQVRQPLYRSSMKRWTRYVDELKPLIKEIEPYLDDQAELLKEHGVRVNRPLTVAWFRKLLVN